MFIQLFAFCMCLYGDIVIFIVYLQIYIARKARVRKILKKELKKQQLEDIRTHLEPYHRGAYYHRRAAANVL